MLSYLRFSTFCFSLRVNLHVTVIVPYWSCCFCLLAFFTFAILHFAHGSFSGLISTFKPSGAASPGGVMASSMSFLTFSSSLGIRPSTLMIFGYSIWRKSSCMLKSRQQPKGQIAMAKSSSSCSSVVQHALNLFPKKSQSSFSRALTRS
jgi:hypothetical protein